MLSLDILLVQEFQSLRGEWENQQAICRSMGSWPESFGEWEREAFPDPRICNGVVIFSRYPITEASPIHLPRITRKAIHAQGIAVERRMRVAASCTVKTRQFGALQVLNTHLDTQLTVQERISQFSPILEIARAYPQAVVGGDLNTDPFEWIATKFIRLPYLHWGKKPAENIWRLAERQGFEAIFKNAQTHQWLPLQLDGIFTRGISVKDRGICKMKGTDHRLLWIEC